MLRILKERQSPVKAEPDDPVCTVRPLGEEPEEEKPAEEGEAEPEVIGREQKEQPEDKEE